jgi:transposase
MERTRAVRGRICVRADRKAKRAIAHLEGFRAVLQVDGYAGCCALAERGDVHLALCWIHVR